MIDIWREGVNPEQLIAARLTPPPGEGVRVEFVMDVPPYHVGERGTFHRVISHELVARGVAVYAEVSAGARTQEGRRERS
jgi:hypothetical protein